MKVVALNFDTGRIYLRIFENTFVDSIDMDVDFYGIPIGDQGKEVTINLQFSNTESKFLHEFWTDSNGLKL
jgi:hypothetical protein